MRHQHLSDRQRKWFGGLAFLIFLGFCVLVGWFIGRPMLALVDEPERFRDWVDERGIWGRLIFIGMTALQVIVALIPGEPLELGAGYAFGVLEGTLLALTGIVLGSAIVFCFVRSFGIRVVEIFFSREKIHSLKFLQDSRKLNIITFAILLIPGTPKDLLAYFIGLTDMKLSTWLLISAVARIPSVISSVISGNALGTQNYRLAILASAITAGISLIGLGIYHLIQRRGNRATEKKS